MEVIPALESDLLVRYFPFVSPSRHYRISLIVIFHFVEGEKM